MKTAAFSQTSTAPNPMHAMPILSWRASDSYTHESRQKGDDERMQTILDRTLENQPPNERELRGYPLMDDDELPRCGRCGCTLFRDEPDGLCDTCAIASANAEERRADLTRLLQRHGVEYVEDLPAKVLQRHQAEHRRGVF